MSVLAWALDPSEPVEEPKTHSTGKIENDFTDLDLDIVFGSLGHEFTPGMYER